MKDGLSLALLELDEQALGRLDVEGGDEQVRVVRGDLDNVVALAKLLALLVQDDSVLVQILGLTDDWHSVLILSGHATGAIASAVAAGASLAARHQSGVALPATPRVGSLNPWQVLPSLLLSRGQHESRPTVVAIKLVGELANIVSDLLDVVEFALPAGDAVCGLLVLQSLENGLILDLDFLQFIPALVHIETSLVAAV